MSEVDTRTWISRSAMFRQCNVLFPSTHPLYTTLTDHCTHLQVEFTPTHIRRVTPTGIDLVDGTSHTLDVLICATGYDTSYHYPFPMYGIDSQTLTSQWHQDSSSSHPEPPSTYLSICTSTFPNYFFSLGPNSAVGSGSLLALIEAEVGYAVEVGLKMQRERVKRVVVRSEAVEDYMEYVQVSFCVCGFLCVCFLIVMWCGLGL